MNYELRLTLPVGINMWRVCVYSAPFGGDVIYFPLFNELNDHDKQLLLNLNLNPCAQFNLKLHQIKCKMVCF